MAGNCRHMKLGECDAEFVAENMSPIPACKPAMDPSFPSTSHSSDPPVDQQLQFGDLVVHTTYIQPDTMNSRRY